MDLELLPGRGRIPGSLLYKSPLRIPGNLFPRELVSPRILPDWPAPRFSSSFPHTHTLSAPSRTARVGCFFLLQRAAIQRRAAASAGPRGAQHRSRAAIECIVRSPDFRSKRRSTVLRLLHPDLRPPLLPEAELPAPPPEPAQAARPDGIPACRPACCSRRKRCTACIRAWPATPPPSPPPSPDFAAAWADSFRAIAAAEAADHRAPACFREATAGCPCDHSAACFAPGSPPARLELQQISALAARTLSSHAHHPATGPGVRDWALSLIPDLTLASLLKVIEYAQELDNNSSEG